jgi:hypothetical protein
MVYYCGIPDRAKRKSRYRGTTARQEGFLGGSWNVSKIVGGLIVLALVAWLSNPFACCPGGNVTHSGMVKVINSLSCAVVEGQSIQSCMQPATPCSSLAANLLVLNSGLNTASQATPMLPPFVTITGAQITYVTPCHSVIKLKSVFIAEIEEPPRV